MATSFTPLADEPWSNDWNYAIESYFGDPDEDEDSGNVATIRAESDEQAEQRVIIYVTNNYDDDFSGARTVSEGAVADGVYRVRMIMGKRR